MRDDQSPRRPLDLRRTMTDARQRLVEAEDNPFMTDAGRVAELDARTARKTAADRRWWQFPDGARVRFADPRNSRDGDVGCRGRGMLAHDGVFYARSGGVRTRLARRGVTT